VQSGCNKRSVQLGHRLVPFTSMSRSSSAQSTKSLLPLRTVHRIDADERLCFVDAGFRRAAVAAGMDDLPDRVLGTPLFSHLTGEPTKQWYRYLLDHVARYGAASFEFYCDTPTLIRRQQMDIRRLDDGSVEFAARTLSTSPRLPAPVLDWATPRSHKRILMCSWCLRVSSVIGWLDVDQAAHVLQVFEEAIPPSIDYTICDDDRQRLLALIKPRLD
jgi:hypothetical protein